MMPGMKPVAEFADSSAAYQGPAMPLTIVGMSDGPRDLGIAGWNSVKTHVLDVL